MGKSLGKVAAVEPATASGALHEMLCFCRRYAVSGFADVAASRYLSHPKLPAALMGGQCIGVSAESQHLRHAALGFVQDIASPLVPRCLERD